MEMSNDQLWQVINFGSSEDVKTDRFLWSHVQVNMEFQNKSIKGNWELPWNSSFIKIMGK